MRVFLLVSSGILFLVAAAALIIIGSGEKDSMFIIMAGFSIPFIFTAYWNFYSVIFERKQNVNEGHFTVKAAGYYSIGALYHSAISVPFFLVLFGSAALAITIAFLSANNSTEDIGFALLILSFTYSTALTVYYSIRIGKPAHNPEENNKQNERDFSFKVAFFFASVATLGLFPLVYFVYRSIRKKSG